MRSHSLIPLIPREPWTSDLPGKSRSRKTSSLHRIGAVKAARKPRIKRTITVKRMAKAG